MRLNSDEGLNWVGTWEVVILGWFYSIWNVVAEFLVKCLCRFLRGCIWHHIPSLLSWIQLGSSDFGIVLLDLVCLWNLFVCLVFCFFGPSSGDFWEFVYELISFVLGLNSVGTVGLFDCNWIVFCGIWDEMFLGFILCAYKHSLPSLLLVRL